jgi:hypothetical protein
VIRQREKNEQVLFVLFSCVCTGKKKKEKKPMTTQTIDWKTMRFSDGSKLSIFLGGPSLACRGSICGPLSQSQLNMPISKPFYEPAVRIPTKEEDTPDPVLVHLSYGKENPGPYVLRDLLNQLNEYYRKSKPFYTQDEVVEIKQISPEALMQRKLLQVVTKPRVRVGRGTKPQRFNSKLRYDGKSNQFSDGGNLSWELADPVFGAYVLSDKDQSLPMSQKYWFAHVSDDPLTIWISSRQTDNRDYDDICPVDVNPSNGRSYVAMKDLIESVEKYYGGTFPVDHHRFVEGLTCGDPDPKTRKRSCEFALGS